MIARIEQNADGCGFDLVRDPDTGRIQLSGTEQQRQTSLTIMSVFSNRLAEGNTSAVENGWKITVTDVSIFMRDNFDFEGPDSVPIIKLGNWDCEEKKFTYNPIGNFGNADFRVFRDGHFIVGDFYVYATPKMIVPSVDGTQGGQYVFGIMNRAISPLLSAVWSAALLLFYPLLGMSIAVFILNDMEVDGEIPYWGWDAFFSSVRLQWMGAFRDPLTYLIFAPVVILAAQAFWSRSLRMHFIASIVTLFGPSLVLTGLHIVQ
jgi:hypothetical protein